jgi:hypothetical protein
LVGGVKFISQIPKHHQENGISYICIQLQRRDLRMGEFVGGCGCGIGGREREREPERLVGGAFTSTGAILVLFILLVIITKACLF